MLQFFSRFLPIFSQFLRFFHCADLIPITINATLVLTQPLNSSMRETFTLGSRCEGLYKVNGKPIHALVHDTDLQCALWHKRFAHLHYKALPHVRKMVSGILEISLDHEGVFLVCKWKACKETILFKQKKKVVRYILIYVDLCLYELQMEIHTY